MNPEVQGISQEEVGGGWSVGRHLVQMMDCRWRQWICIARLLESDRIPKDSVTVTMDLG